MGKLNPDEEAAAPDEVPKAELRLKVLLLDCSSSERV